MMLALGLMSGTSMDGIDAAILQTDGVLEVKAKESLFQPYDEGFRTRLRGMLGQIEGTSPELEALEAELTDRHAEAVLALSKQAGIAPGDLDVIGFHGHTIAHAPDRGLTRQIGDGAKLARALGVRVVDDFRSADMKAGGQGAPLAPLYHAALVRRTGSLVLPPVGVLNVGGIANVTMVGLGAKVEDGLRAFDTGPGNALIDDWISQHTESFMDEDGRLAAAGTVNEAALQALLEQPHCANTDQRSLDRGDYSLDPVQGLSLEDGAATLVAFTAKTVMNAKMILGAGMNAWIVTGGGRKNPALMEALRAELHQKVLTAEDEGWDGDMLEAQAFAYLAVRSLRGLPLSVFGTTGVTQPTTGGILHEPA